MDVTKYVEFFETHRKFFVAVAAGAVAAYAVVADGEFSLNDAFVIFAALGLGPVGVERVPNDSKVKAAAKRVVRQAQKEV